MTSAPAPAPPAPSSSPKYKLVHFNSRPLAEPIRLIFAALGIEYTDERVANWKELKPKTPWGNLPLLYLDEDEDKTISQSGAILRYLGRVHNLNGDTDWEAAKCDELIEAMVDLRIAYFTAFLEQDPDKKAELEQKMLAETFPLYLGRLEAMLNNNKAHENDAYLVGQRLSIGDLCVAAYLQIYAEYLFNKERVDLFDKYPALKRHQKLVFGLQGVKEWVERRPL